LHIHEINSAPWLGYLMLVEKNDLSMASISNATAQYPLRPEFEKTSYLDRYKLLCQKLMLGKHYTQCALIETASNEKSFASSTSDISIEVFLYSFWGFLVGKQDEFR
jgi:hypothetical protein